MLITEGYLRFHRPLVGWLMRRVKDAELAQDLAQDVWLVAIAKWDADQGERQTAAFLFRTARNEMLWHFEHRRRWRDNVVPTLMVFKTSTPVAACRYCGESINQYADYRSAGVCLMHYTRLRRGSDLTKPKMVHHDEGKVRMVRSLLAAGHKGRVVAMMVGMSEAQVSRIKNGVQRAAVA